MKSDNKRNTAKEKAKNNKGFPYKASAFDYINKPGKYEIVDDNNKSYGSFRLLVTARMELKKLKKELIRDDLVLEFN